MPLQVELVSPERILYSGEADIVVCRTLGGGDIAFLPGHAPFLGALAHWPVTIRGGGEEETVAVHGGFVEVSDDTVIILSDVAELASQIDVDRARQARERAERAVMDRDDVECQAALSRAHLRLRVAGAA